jgi:hypothetical protein
MQAGPQRRMSKRSRPSADAGIERPLRAPVLPLGRPAVGARRFLRALAGIILRAALGPSALPAGGALFERPILRTIRFPVAGRSPDFELVELVPLFVGAIPLGDGKEFANAAARIDGLGIVHVPHYEPTPRLIQPAEIGCPNRPPAGLSNGVAKATAFGPIIAVFFERLPCGSETSRSIACPKP